jgi:clathrin heavy chain
MTMPQDNAALAMIERSADAWEHNQFKDVIVRAANVEMYVLPTFTICY